MKKLVNALALVSTLGFAVNALANDDNKEDEPISPEEDESLQDVPEVLDNGVTATASSVGAALQNNPCAGASYAEQVYCYPAQWLADLLPCTYGKGTPQATMCGNKSWAAPGDDKKNGDYDGSRAIGEVFELNPEFRPVRAKSEGLRKHLLPHLEKKKKGQVVHRWKDGTRLILRTKISMPRKADQAFVFEMVNPKGRVIGRPVYYFKGRTLHINDLSRQKKKR